MRTVAGVLTAPTTATWIWRITTLLYLLITILRSSIFIEALPESIWQAAQFGVVIAGLLLTIFVRAKIKIDGSAHKLFYASLAFFMLVALASVLVSVAPMKSGTQWLISLVMLSFVVWSATSRWRTDRTLVRDDLKFLAIFWSIVQILGFVLLLVAPDRALGQSMRFVGLFSNANYAGMISAATLVLLLGLARSSRNRRAFVYYGLLAFPMLVALILSGSRGSSIACAIGVAILLMSMTNRVSLRMLVGAAAVVVVLGTVLIPAEEIRSSLEGTVSSPEGQLGSDGSPTSAYDALETKTSGRLSIWKQSLEAWSKSPVLGIGYRAAAEVNNGMETHNLPLQVLLETGILGLLAWLGMLMALVMQLRRERLDPAIAALLVTVLILELSESSMFGWGGPTAFYFWTIFVAAFYSPNWYKSLRVDTDLLPSEQSS